MRSANPEASAPAWVKELNEQLGGAELSDSELPYVLDAPQEKPGNFRSLLAILSPRLVSAQ